MDRKNGERGMLEKKKVKEKTKSIKVVSNSSEPQKSISWNYLAMYFDKLDNEHFCELDWSKISEIHILGSKKEDSEIQIEENLWGEYLNDSGCLICIYDFHTEDIPWITNLTDKVSVLDIRFLKIKTIDLSKMVNIRILTLSDNSLLREIIGLEYLTALKNINFNMTKVEEIPMLSCFPGLSSLNLRGTMVKELNADSQMLYLKFLNLNDSKIVDVSCIENFPNLLRVYLSGLDITKLPTLSKLRRLESLNCSHTKVDELPEIGDMIYLKSLNISYTHIKSIEDVRFPAMLRTLILDGTPIDSIPISITRLHALRKLMLNDMHLKTLPREILDLCLDFNFSNKGFGIGLLDTVIEDMDVSIFQQPRDIIEYWFLHRNLHNGQQEEALNEAKVVFLGDGGAGKSLSIHRLLNDCTEQPSFNGESTPGISIQDNIYTIDGKKILIHYWDFGGQEIMHSMHRMFLTRRTLYVVFINARDNTQDERARYWLHNIKSFAENSPVILVINQIDQNPSASVNEPALKALYPELKDIVKLSATCYSKEEFEKNLQRKIIDELINLPIINEPFLISWKNLKYRLQSMKEYYIDKQEFLSICNKCEVENSISLRMQLLDWFADLGVSFCYQDSRQLADYMILRPDWITNAIYIILFNCASMSANGVISHENIYNMLGDQKSGKRVLNGVTYSTNEVEYVLGVIRKFRLSYRIDEGMEFIPMLCNRNENAISEKFYGRNDVLEYNLQYPYLPLNVIHRLMVELRHDLKSEYVWLTGAVFESPEMGFSALVKTEDNYLRIYVYAQNELFPASSYLGFIRTVLKDINASMGLFPTEKIIYKENDSSDEFDYEYILDSYEHGNKTIYSSKLKRNLDIRNILNQTDGENHARKEKLLNDLIDGCKMLQGNKLFWDSTEDQRNTFIRDIMRSKRYICSDQTLMGKSQSGKSAGEIDIEVFETESKPMALIEALNISGFSNSSIEYWNVHLKKLLDNYNPIGMPVVFLISYLECSKDSFKEIWMKYYKHISSYSCGTYILQRANEYVTDASFYCRVAECQYDRSGMPTMVYHILVRLGE